MSKVRNQNTEFRYPTPNKPSNHDISENSEEVELYYMGEEIQPYSLEDLNIEEVDKVVGVDSYGNIGEYVKKHSNGENVLTILSENTENLKDVMEKIAESDDDVSYIITDDPRSDYLIETYADGKIVERLKTNEYSQAKDMAHAKVMRTSLETIKLIEKANSNLKQIIEEYEDNTLENDSKNQEVEALEDSIEVFEENLERAEQGIGSNTSPSLHDEVRALSAKKQMIIPQIQETLEGQRNFNPSLEEKNFN